VILDAEAPIEKHRGQGVLVDANLLVLFIVGSVKRQRIETFKIKLNGRKISPFRTLPFFAA
jgi:hypothetical protein